MQSQCLLQSGAVYLTGTDPTIAQVSAFIESLDKQLRTHSYDPLDMETTDPELPDAEVSSKM